MSQPAFVSYAEIALEAQYAVYGVPAAWTSVGGGDPVPCTVIKLSPDQDVHLGSGRANVATNQLSVRVSEVASIAHNDVFAITGVGNFRVMVSPPADDFGLEWVCEVASA